MSKDAAKEGEGPANAGAGAPGLDKDVVVYSTDMSEDARRTVTSLARRAFHAPVNHGKVYQTVADAIRTECEKEVDGGGSGGGGAGGGGRDGPGGGGDGEASGGGEGGGTAIGSGGWSCVVGDAFGSSVTHRMKTYIHFSVVPGVNVLLWKS